METGYNCHTDDMYNLFHCLVLLAELRDLQAIIFCDYIITFVDEVTTVWRRKLSLASVSILTNRYALLGFASSLVAMLLPTEANSILNLVRSQ